MADPVISPPEVAFTSPLEHPRRQLEALLEVSEAIAQQRDLRALFHDLAERLHSVIEFDFLTLVLHDSGRNVMRLHILETRIPGEKPTGTEAPVENNPSGWVWQTQESFVVSDVEEETRFPEFLKRFREHNVRSLAILPLTTAQHRLGAMGFGRIVPQRITDTEVQFMQRVAGLVAVAVDNALNFETSQAYQTQLARERDRLQVLLEVNNVLVTSRELPEVFRSIVSTLKRVILHDYTSLALLDPVSGLLKIHALDFPGHQGLFKQEIAIAVENALAFKEIDALKNKLAVEKLYLEEEIRSEFNFEEIVGESIALKRALAQVELAAPAGTTVLLLGETGTGKELFARAIHNLSPRRDRTFVKINCAAIPSGLLESELFGHEKGAFTGAINQKIGRFELADRGTLLLDEVGDLPLELQPKLLRVLQEQEFERLGGTRTTRVDVRVVAATNSDLSKLVAERAFRSDLYYRLNVFPIQIPALRERPEDIPLLVRYFVQKFSRSLNKEVEYIPADAMEALSNYSWPGNIRELENLLERAVILSPGKELRGPLSELKSATLAAAAGSDSSSSFTSLTSASSSTSSISTLEEAERQHILRALKQTQWRIAGPKGAAVLLGMKRTTLQARMRKLSIRRPV